MNQVREDLHLDGVPLIRLESDYLRADVAPAAGGRVVSLVEKSGGHEFLWRNRALRLESLPAGSEYDPNFFGGIDELFPNDIPEEINGVSCPDHGELWTLPLIEETTGHKARIGSSAKSPLPFGRGEGQGEGLHESARSSCVHPLTPALSPSVEERETASGGGRLKLTGTLPRFGLRYERIMALRDDGPFLDLDYRISNPTSQPRQFLWKLHAALSVQPNDVIDCPARQAQVVDLNYSRFTTPSPFAWPHIEGRSANVIPPADGTMDFFYLFDLREGRMAWRRPAERLEFAYQFDTRVFPYAWLFASYGGFLGHYTAILEPCSAMPISVNEAASKKQCSVLQPGETLETRVTIRAGPILL